MTQKVQSVIVHPGTVSGGELEVPGDKSISHRLVMLSLLATGTSRIEGFLESEDCMNTLRAVEVLGARTNLDSDGLLTIEGTGGNLLEPAGALDMGNSGTSMRLMAGLLAGAGGSFELTGDTSLRSRPMARIKKPLEQMGAKVELLGEGKFPPIRIAGGGLKGIEYELPVASAQVKSCILLAGLFAKGGTVVVEPAPSRDHTERLLRAMGVPLKVEGLRIALGGYGAEGPKLTGRSWRVPGDFSSAAFFVVAAAGRKGAELTIRNVGLNARRTALLDVLKEMGADIEVIEHLEQGEEEPIGDIIVRGTRLQGVEVGGERIPAMIDELPLVAVAGAVAKGTTTIRDAAELRVKESDRIAAMAENLRRFGVKVKETEDGMVIQGRTRFEAREAARSYGDHRIAMAMAVLALHAKEPVCVSNVACVNTSYPTFWESLRKVGVHVE